MNVLITGGAGFIGSHLSEKLLSIGHEVYVIDDLSTGSIRNIEHLLTNPKFHLSTDTVTNETLLSSVVDKIDIIYHLAAAVGVQLVVKSPVKTIETNVHGTEVVLKAAAKENKKVLIASTSEVYGKSKNIPYKEDDNLLIGPPTFGRWSYACSKALDEFLAMAYWKEKKLPVVITRFFNTIGPKQTGQYGMVVPTFIKQALSGKPITVYGDGKQRRCFTYVGDVVNAIIALMEKDKAIGQIFNIGGTEEISIEDLAKKIKQLTNSSSEIVHIPYDQAYEQGFEDMRRRIPDISKLSRMLSGIGNFPKHGLDETLKLIIENFKLE
ncbi:MAG: GDP-mannose 4,6-dehydratase [bacterium]|nr:GDP-mannose 4,6-dehydratase [bacterium]